MATRRYTERPTALDRPRPQYVTRPNGKVVAVLVLLEDWIALLEHVCDLEQKLKPSNALDRRVEVIVRKEMTKKKQADLDDIGFIGTGRAMSEAESLLVSAHIQAAKAQRAAGMKKVKPSRARRVPSVKA